MAQPHGQGLIRILKCFLQSPKLCRWEKPSPGPLLRVNECTPLQTDQDNTGGGRRVLHKAQGFEKGNTVVQLPESTPWDLVSHFIMSTLLGGRAFEKLGLNEVMRAVSLRWYEWFYDERGRGTRTWLIW